MNATIITNQERSNFKEWQELEQYLNACEDKKQMHQLNISIDAAGSFWQYIFDLDTSSTLQILYVLKEVEYKVSKIHEKYQLLLLQDKSK